MSKILGTQTPAATKIVSGTIGMQTPDYHPPTDSSVSLTFLDDMSEDLTPEQIRLVLKLMHADRPDLMRLWL